MPLTFVGTLDRSAVTAAVDQLTELVGSAEVADAWEQESTLPGLTVGGLTRHLVSQPECAVEMASTGHTESVEVLARSREQLAAAIAVAGPTTYVPWQGCALPMDDFLVVRLMEIVVHADDLACSVGVAAPRFASEALEPVLALLAALSARRRGQDAVLRALSRHERSVGSVSAF